MEGRTKKESNATATSDRSSISIIDAIKDLCALNARSSLDNEKQLLLYLQSWWSRTYNRPLKDPILLSYSIEELLYEFYDRIERAKAADEQLESEDDKIEVDKEQELLDWAEQEEKKELEALKVAAANSLKEPVKDPTKDADNIAWMEEQLQKAKEIHGESFGEDVEEDFSR